MIKEAGERQSEDSNFMGLYGQSNNKQIVIYYSQYTQSYSNTIHHVVP